MSPTDITNAIATAVIACFAVAQFVLQARQHSHDVRIANASYKVDLHDKRMLVYGHLEAFLQSFMREGRPNFDAAMKLKYETRNADFVFPASALGVIEEIAQNALKYQECYLTWEPLRARAFAGEQLGSEEGPRSKKALDTMHKLEHWFLAQVQDGRLKRDLGPYLQLPDAL